MWAIFKKEINTFFSSLIGYIAIAVFLTSTGLFIWVFPETNLLDFGYATLNPLFMIAPWVFMFLIPAITMRSFAEELKSGTLEVLMTRPVTDIQIIMGKYFAALVLVLFSLLPTLLYYYTIYMLSSPAGNVDNGAIWGSYIGLFLLAACFVAIGIFASSLTSNQIIAFIAGICLCFLLYIGFDFMSQFETFFGRLDYLIQQVGIDAHYNAVSRGVLDTRDLLYFLSMIALFIVLTKMTLESRKW